MSERGGQGFIRRGRFGLTRAAALGVVFLLCSPPTEGYSVLTHEAIVDSAWETSIQKLLLKRFPDATQEELEKAHAYTYGGCIIQDMGYYPFGSHLFSDLTHYVRSGDFILALLREAHDLNEYAFALGALAHYASDNTGHRLATNPSVPLLYPKLAAKFGKNVTYWDDPTSHLRTEFSFDVLQVASGRYDSGNYHKFIGFEVSKPVLERAFAATYGVEMKDLFASLDLAMGTYRYSVSSMIPGMTRVAWALKKDQIPKDFPQMTRRKFLYNLRRSSYEKDFGKGYRRPSLRIRIIALMIRIVPKIGPFKSLAFRPPTPEVEKLYVASFKATAEAYRTLLANLDTGQLRLPNRNFDVGDLTRLGAYQGTDEAYSKLVAKLADRKFNGMSAELRANILSVYQGSRPPSHAKDGKAAKKEEAEWMKLQEQLTQLQAAQVDAGSGQ